MPDSTSDNRILGHKDAPVIQFDDKADVTDVYAFMDVGSAGVRNAAITDPVSDSSGIGPNNYRFDDQSIYKINLCETDRDTTPANTSLPFGGSALVGDPAGFPNGRRGEDDVLDTAPGDVVAGLSTGSGSFAEKSDGSGLDRNIFDDGLYDIKLKPPTTGSRPDPLADNGDLFNQDDPEDHSVGELFL